MSDEPKRLTADELRAQQREREAAEQKAKMEQQRARAEREAANRSAQIKAGVDRVKETWYGFVQRASQLNGARCCVVARVVGSEAENALRPVLDAIKADGYRPILAGSGVSFAPAPGGAPRRAAIGAGVPDADEALVELGGMRGYRPAQVPQFGESGAMQWLVIAWSTDGT